MRDDLELNDNELDLDDELEDGVIEDEDEEMEDEPTEDSDDEEENF